MTKKILLIVAAVFVTIIAIQATQKPANIKTLSQGYTVVSNNTMHNVRVQVKSSKSEMWLGYKQIDDSKNSASVTLKPGEMIEVMGQSGFKNGQYHVTVKGWMREVNQTVNTYIK